jgi:hypothetical protein
MNRGGAACHGAGDISGRGDRVLQRELDPEDPNAVVNPALLVEVLSDATEAYSRGEKSRITGASLLSAST